jgi:hypothetical protein
MRMATVRWPVQSWDESEPAQDRTTLLARSQTGSISLQVGGLPYRDRPAGVQIVTPGTDLLAAGQAAWLEQH